MEVLGIIFLCLLILFAIFGLPYFMVIHPEIKEAQVKRIKKQILRPELWRVEQYRVSCIRRSDPDKHFDCVGFRLVKENSGFLDQSIHVTLTEKSHALDLNEVDFSERLAEYRVKAYEMCESLNASERLITEHHRIKTV